MFSIYTGVNLERKNQNLTHCEIMDLNKSPSRAKSTHLAKFKQHEGVSSQNPIGSSLTHTSKIHGFKDENTEDLRKGLFLHCLWLYGAK